MKNLISTAQRSSLPEREEYLTAIQEVLQVLRNEDQSYRLHDEKDRPGGLVRLSDKPVIVVPDLHGRMWFLLHVLNHTLDDQRVADLLHRGEIQIVCVGDGFHAEARAAARWKKAFKEYVGHYRRHAAMDAEMRENLGLMEIVMRLKTAYPESFHFLKGNHENILNEEGRGNHPFRKFAYEGEMVKDWVVQFYGEEFIDQYAEFEHELPLIAADRTFMISHSEPMYFIPREEVIRYREYEDVVLGLTWTPDGGSEEGSVRQMIREYCSEPERAVYFGGHRPVSGRYNLRAEELYIQLHNPFAYGIAVLRPGVMVEPDRDITVLNEDNETVAEESRMWPEW